MKKKRSVGVIAISLGLILIGFFGVEESIRNFKYYGMADIEFFDVIGLIFSSTLFISSAGMIFLKNWARLLIIVQLSMLTVLLIRDARDIFNINFIVNVYLEVFLNLLLYSLKQLYE